MKSTYLIASLFAFCLLLSFGCGRHQEEQSAQPKEKTYDVKGVVREIDLKDKSVVIEHEIIPGYMDAMTMPFNVRDTNLLAGVAADDTVKFPLVGTETD